MKIVSISDGFILITPKNLYLEEKDKMIRELKNFLLTYNNYFSFLKTGFYEVSVGYNKLIGTIFIIKKEEDFELVRRLADLLGAEIAGTRPIIELGWLDPKRQIGLSGRTVKPKLIITVGISGAVQFAAGMKNSDRIIAINSDPAASIFNIAHYGFVGDLYEILPKLIEKLAEEKQNV